LHSAALRYSPTAPPKARRNKRKVRWRQRGSAICPILPRLKPKSRPPWLNLSAILRKTAEAQSQAQLRVAQSQSLAYAAESLRITSPETALLLASEAFRRDDNFVTAQTLRDALGSAPFGMRNDTFFRLFSRAPRISMYSWGMKSPGGCFSIRS
jgi:hypothetical protein